MTGNLIIITSPSGGGKGTLIREVLEQVPNIGYSVSYTTRPRRVDEENGREYYFVTVPQFERLKAEGEFLESALVHDNYYGTSKKRVAEVIDAGKDVILEIDVQGAKLVLDAMPDAVSIFIMPPSFDVLRARLTARATENPYDLDLRLRNSFDEVRDFERFHYVVVNEELFRAADDLKAIILAERHRRDRQSAVIKDILDSFDASKIKLSGE